MLEIAVAAPFAFVDTLMPSGGHGQGERDHVLGGHAAVRRELHGGHTGHAANKGYSRASPFYIFAQYIKNSRARRLSPASAGGYFELMTIYRKYTKCKIKCYTPVTARSKRRL